MRARKRYWPKRGIFKPSPQHKTSHLIKEMILDGATNEEIIAELGCGKCQISQIRKRLKK